MLSREYHEDIVDIGVTAKEFAHAVKLVRQRCTFFPKVADIMAAVNEYRKNPPVSDCVKIGETSSNHDPTPEEIELSKKLRELATMALDKKITADEAAEKMEELIKHTSFAGRLAV